MWPPVVAALFMLLLFFVVCHIAAGLTQNVAATSPTFTVPAEPSGPTLVPALLEPIDCATAPAALQRLGRLQPGGLEERCSRLQEMDTSCPHIALVTMALGNCRQMMGRSLDAYEAYGRVARQADDRSLQKAAKAAMAKVEDQIPRLRLTLEHPDAWVRVDGRPLAAGELVPVNPGRHRLELGVGKQVIESRWELVGTRERIHEVRVARERP
jgi:hypothetical protein